MRNGFWSCEKGAVALVACVLLAGGSVFAAAEKEGEKPESSGLEPSSGVSGSLRREHVAGINAFGDLDGPAKESMGFGGQGFEAGVDTDGNIWEFGGRWMRASDARIMRIDTCEYGSLGFDLKEGPVVGRSVVYAAKSYGWPCRGTTMLGRPDLGGKDEGIYDAIGREGKLLRIWKNKEKGYRWWFALVAGGGTTPAPKVKGQSADALAMNFGWINQPQTGLDGKIRFLANNAFYLLENGKVTCILGPDDYKAATDVMNAVPNEGYVGGDGSIYLGYYYVSSGAFKGTLPAVWRVAPDGKVEPFARSQGQGTGDGDALTQAGWFCGPHFKQSYRFARFLPPDAMLTSAHDEDFVKRIWKGRVSCLNLQGEWVEYTEIKRRGSVSVTGLTIGLNGTVYFSGRSIREMRLYKYTGVDFSKPTSKQRSK